MYYSCKCNHSDVTHLGYNDDGECISCLIGKAKKYASRKNKERNVLKGKPTFGKLSIDTKGPIDEGVFIPEMRKVKFAQISKDRDTKHVGIDFKRSTASAQSVAAFLRAHRNDLARIEEVRSDGGPEWKKAFDKFLVGILIAHGKSVPNDPESNSFIERTIQDIIVGTAASLEHSGAPHFLWPCATKVYVDNVNFTVPTPSGKTAHVLKTGRKYKGKVMPFGAQVVYTPLRDDDERPTGRSFQGRGRKGIFIGYSRTTPVAYTVLDEQYARNGEVKYVTTQSVRVHMNEGEYVYPFKDMPHVGELLSDAAFLMTAPPIVKCLTCRKFKVNALEPVMCKGCRGKHRGHAKSTQCRYHRCACDQEQDDVLNFQGQVAAETPDEDQEVEPIQDVIPPAVQVDDGMIEAVDAAWEDLFGDLSDVDEPNDEVMSDVEDIPLSHADTVLDDDDEDEGFVSAAEDTAVEDTAIESSDEEATGDHHRQASRYEIGEGTPENESFDAGKLWYGYTDDEPDDDDEVPSPNRSRGSGDFGGLPADRRGDAEVRREHQSREVRELQRQIDYYDKRGEENQFAGHANYPTDHYAVTVITGNDNDAHWNGQVPGGAQRVTTKVYLKDGTVVTNGNRVYSKKLKTLPAQATHPWGEVVRRETYNQRGVLIERCLRKEAMMWNLITLNLSKGDPRSKSTVAFDARQKEAAKFRDTFKAINLDTVKEMDDVIRDNPDALFAWSNMLTSIKGMEKDEQEYKGRLVILGDGLRDKLGRVMKSTDYGLVTDPISLAEFRYLLALGALEPNAVSISGDEQNAYLGTELGGDEVYLHVQEHLCTPEVWEQIGRKFKRPVVRLEKAGYGLERSGHDYEANKGKRLTANGWKRVEGTRSLFIKEYAVKKIGRCNVYLGTFIDDFLFTGNMTAVQMAIDETKKYVTYKEKPDRVKNHLGMEVSQETERRDDWDYLSKITVSQIGYAKLWIKEFLHDTGLRKLSNAKTPFTDERWSDVSQQPGQYAKIASKHFGALQWLQRGSCPQIAFALSTVGAHMHEWTKVDDATLVRIYRYVQYLLQTKELKVTMKVCSRDKETIKMQMHVDADFAGHKRSKKSQTGMVVFLKGEDTFALIDWCSKMQPCVARSSGEAEVCGANDLLIEMDPNAKRTVQETYSSEVKSKKRKVKEAYEAHVPGIDLEKDKFVYENLVRGAVSLHASTVFVPMIGQMREMLASDIEAEIYMDATVAISSITKGHSRRLAYMRHIQGVDLAWMLQLVQLLGIKIKKVASESNLADPFTKNIKIERADAMYRLLMDPK